MKWKIVYEIWTPNGTVFGSKPFNTKDEAVAYRDELRKLYKSDLIKCKIKPRKR